MPAGDPPSSPFAFSVPMLRAHAGYLSWIVLNGVGLEIQDLMDPNAAPESLADIGTFWGRALSGQEIPVSFHGPPVSELFFQERGDRECLTRLVRAMEIAAKVGAKYFIVSARSGTHQKEPAESLVFKVWEEVLREAKARNLFLLLENTGQDRPEVQKEVISTLGSDGFGLCLNVGHALRNSHFRCTEWVEAWGPDLHFVHLYNTTREGAEFHRALGDGEIDMEGFLGLLRQTHPGITVCLEMDVPQILASVPWLTARGLFKLKSIQESIF